MDAEKLIGLTKGGDPLNFEREPDRLPIRGITYDEQRIVDLEDRVIKLTEASKKVLETRREMNEIPIGAYAMNAAISAHNRALEDLKAVVESRGLSTWVTQTSEEVAEIQATLDQLAAKFERLKSKTEVRSPDV